ncbi:MAG: hypothetical protein KKE30_05035 [Gammaproteobacteria bacterium]|nr:hypothetical protein [Gammaproteobacteria bacterium]MBU1554048.1 hypothetical protein [Gammaproteobacteria bacterium]MBU2071676.1 hypothetical protein [Gammaproteobacteria bacterium]MBU2204032.1 hypothetical protein [Gammaproteobacteria bacterium]
MEANIVIGRLWSEGKLVTAMESDDVADWVLQQRLLELPDINQLDAASFKQAQLVYPELLNLRLQQAKPNSLTLGDALADCLEAASYFSIENHNVAELDDNTHLTLQQAFYSHFNRFWLALHQLMLLQSEHKILVDIAVAVPVFCPDLPAYELALQRRSLCHCIEHYGIEFVAAHLHQLRPDLIIYLAERLLHRTGELQYLLQLMQCWQGVAIFAPKQDAIHYLTNKLSTRE